MDNTTKKGIEKIKKQGYFNAWDTLGTGGWNQVYEFSQGWKTFDLYHKRKGVLQTIITKDESTAREIFKSFWSLYAGVHIIRLSKVQIYTG